MDNKELLFSVTKEDFRFDYFRAPGNGGQKKNKTESAVRITHPDSGAVAQCSEYREQSRNKKEAFSRIVNSPTFKSWHRRKTTEILMQKSKMKSVDEQVDEAMHPSNLKIENQEEGKWVEDKS